MKILVTGAGGFLGPQIVRRLLERKGVELVRCLVRTNSAALEPLAAADPRVEIVAGNLLTSVDADAAVRGVDTIIHAAAGMTGSPADMYLNTVVTSQRLLEAVERSSVRRVVLISSFSVYGAACRRRGALVDESFCFEPEPQRRDAYTLAKTRQDLLFQEFHRRSCVPLVIVRPGVIYGPGGGAMSTRVALDLGPLVLHMGRGNRLPLTYVVNCAEAIAVAALRDVKFDVVNVVDDDLITCRQYFRRFRREVKPVQFMTLPYFAIRTLASMIAWYHHRSDGQLPAFLTPYIARALWGGNRFSNAHLKEIGWSQLVSTAEGLSLTFDYLRRKARG